MNSGTITKTHLAIVGALAQLGPNGGLVGEIRETACSLYGDLNFKKRNYGLILDTMIRNDLVDRIKMDQGWLYYLTEQGWNVHQNMPRT